MTDITRNVSDVNYRDQDEFAEQPRAAKHPQDMSTDLRGWGIGLLIMGVLHFALAGFLSPAWGIVLIALGLLNLVIRARGMFVANGMALLIVGLMNIFSGGVGGWSIFGCFQIYWGIKEIRKCWLYG